MITQAKLDQAAMELRLLGRGPRRRTLFGLTPGLGALLAPLPFFLDTREPHGLGDLALSALLRASGAPAEPPPRRVTALRREGALLCLETARTRLWLALGAVPDGTEAPPDPRKRHNLALALGADEAPAGFVAEPWAAFVGQARRFMPAYLRGADPFWWAAFADWMTELERATGAETMKDLTDALRFYDRNREKIEGLLAFRRELAEESEGFARRLEAKLRAAGLAEGLAAEPGGRLVLTRTLRLGGKPYDCAWVAEIRLEELALRADCHVLRDAQTRRRPAPEEAQRLTQEHGLAALAAERRIAVENPEAAAYQALKSLLQAAHEAFAARA